MSKRPTTPASRLICFGNARSHTRAAETGEVLELIPSLFYEG